MPPDPRRDPRLDRRLGGLVRVADVRRRVAERRAIAAAAQVPAAQADYEGACSREQALREDGIHKVAAARAGLLAAPFRASDVAAVRQTAESAERALVRAVQSTRACHEVLKALEFERSRLARDLQRRTAKHTALAAQMGDALTLQERSRDRNLAEAFIETQRRGRQA